MNYTPPRHWPPFLKKKEACLYLGITENTFSRWVELAEIEKIPLINRFDRKELDQIGDRMRERVSREANHILSALKK